MEIFITENSKSIIRKHYLASLKKEVYYINPSEIIEKNKLDITNKYDLFILKNILINEILLAYKRKRYKTIIYFLNKINRESIYNIKMLFKELNLYVSSFNLIDFELKADEAIYKFFDKFI